MKSAINRTEAAAARRSTTTAMSKKSKLAPGQVRCTISHHGALFLALGEGNDPAEEWPGVLVEQTTGGRYRLTCEVDLLDEIGDELLAQANRLSDVSAAGLSHDRDLDRQSMAAMYRDAERVRSEVYRDVDRVRAAVLDAE